MPDVTFSEMLAFFLAVSCIYLVITLVTGEAAIEGQDEGIDRRKNPVAYWLLVSIFVLFTAGAAFALITLSQN